MSPHRVLLEFDRPAGHTRPYANLYRFGRDGPAPLVFYVGGLISRAEYEKRRRTEPAALVQAFETARANLGLVRVDLVLCPCPVETGEDGVEWILDHFDEVCCALGRAPSALGCVGYSAGAAYAVHLAVLENAHGLATYGAAGLPAALAALRPMLDARGRAVQERLSFGYFMNDADPLGEGGTAWMQQYGGAIEFHSRRGRGGHGFEDYVASGFVTDAFAFVLERLSRAPATGSRSR